MGPTGQLIGVDSSPEMLARAEERIKRNNWKNVKLILSEMETYEFPTGINGVLSTNAFGYVSEYDKVIRRASNAFVPGGRIVIQDGKRSAGWPNWLFKLGMWVGRPFGITSSYFMGQPWESIERYFQDAAIEEMHFGTLYISSGTAPEKRSTNLSEST